MRALADTTIRQLSVCIVPAHPALAEAVFRGAAHGGAMEVRGGTEFGWASERWIVELLDAEAGVRFKKALAGWEGDWGRLLRCLDAEAWSEWSGTEWDGSEWGGSVWDGGSVS